MRKFFLLGMLIIMTTGGVCAQAVWYTNPAAIPPNKVTDGNIPTDCGGRWVGLDGSSCTFQCSEGDYIYIWGHVNRDLGYRIGVTVTASCGGAAVACTCLNPMGNPCSCEAYAENTVMENDRGGLCTARRADGALTGNGEYYCSSVTPEEAAELEKFGEGLLIKMLEP